VEIKVMHQSGEDHPGDMPSSDPHKIARTVSMVLGFGPNGPNFTEIRPFRPRPNKSKPAKIFQPSSNL
jgi:hypothetical protein